MSTLFIRVVSLKKYTIYLLLLNITIPGIKLRWILQKGTINGVSVLLDITL